LPARKHGSLRPEVFGPAEDGDGIGVVFDDLDALVKAYSFFLDGPTVSLFDQIGDGYVGREIENGIFFGIDKRVLEATRERPSTASARQSRVAEIFEILGDQAQAYESRRDSTASPGRDGTLLVDRRERHI
jgi:hypothetical protein